MSLTNINASMQARDMPEVSKLFIDAITEKQKTNKDDMVISTNWGTARVLHHEPSVQVSSTSVPMPQVHSTFRSTTCGSRQPGTPAGGEGPAQLRTRQWWRSASSPAPPAAAPTTPDRWTGTAPQHSPSHSCQKQAHFVSGGRGKNPDHHFSHHMHWFTIGNLYRNTSLNLVAVK